MCGSTEIVVKFAPSVMCYIVLSYLLHAFSFRIAHVGANHLAGRALNFVFLLCCLTLILFYLSRLNFISIYIIMKKKRIICDLYANEYVP